MVQNVRAYSIPYAITIKCINCMQDKIDFSCMLQRPRLISTKILVLFLATKAKQQRLTIMNCKKIIRCDKRLGSCCPGGHLPPHAIPCQLRTFHCIRVAGALAEISHAIDSSRVKCDV